jgi:predicted acyltransferase
MILVNNPGAWEHTYKPLRHAHWNGWTTADVIFPFFLFIVGVAITFSLSGNVGLTMRRATPTA